MASAMRSESRAVMLTDMKGFTAATLRQTRGENARMLALHDALLLPVVKAFGGVRVKTIGDAYLVIFQAATEALLCGMAIQDRLWEFNRRASEAERMEVRVAVAFGEVRIVKTRGASDVFGDAVNLAARVEGEAVPGDVWFTESASCVADPRSVPFEPMGLRRLKGLAGEVRLFRVARQRGDGEPGPTVPPYGKAALRLVRWLPPPEPAYLARVGHGARPVPRWRVRLVLRALGIAALLCGAVAAALWLRLPRPERLLRLGRYGEAREAVRSLAAQRGPEAPDVLFLGGRVEAASADAGRGGSLRTAFQLWSRGVALGSADALAALEREAGARDCARRQLATRALADARSRRAARALERIAAEEPPAGEAQGPLRRLRSLVGRERCGTGDVARQGLRAIDER